MRAGVGAGVGADAGAGAGVLELNFNCHDCKMLLQAHRPLPFCPLLDLFAILMHMGSGCQCKYNQRVSTYLKFLPRHSSS